jgi:hypothetical protein
VKEEDMAREKEEERTHAEELLLGWGVVPGGVRDSDPGRRDRLRKI